MALYAGCAAEGPHLCELLLRAMGWEGYHLYEMQKGDDLRCAQLRIIDYYRVVRTFTERW